MSATTYRMPPADDPKWEGVRKALAAGKSRSFISQALQVQEGWTQRHASAFVKAVMEKMRLEHEYYKPFDKVTAVERIASLIQSARDKDEIKTAIQGEKLLAQILDTLAPIRIDANVERKQALVDYLDARDPVEVEARIAEIQLIQRKAKFFDQGLSCRDVSPQELQGNVIQMLPPNKRK